MTDSIARASAAPPLRRRRTPRDSGRNPCPGDTRPHRRNRSAHPDVSAVLHRNADAATSQTMDQIDGHH